MKKLFGPKCVPIWVLLAGALYGYSLYSFRYEYLAWSNLPLVGWYAVLSGLCFAGIFTLLYALRREKKRWAAFLLSLLAFQAILWTILTVVNVDGSYNLRAVRAAFAVVLALFGLLCLLTLLTAAKVAWPVPNRILAVLTCLFFCLAAASPILPTKSQLYFAARYEENPSFADFAPLTAGETAVTETEKARVPAFTEKNLRDPALFPFSFRMDGREYRADMPADWTFAMDAPAPVRGGETVKAYWTDPASTLRVTLEAARYPENASYSWTAYLTNIGSVNTPVITELLGIKAAMPLTEPAYYAARGSHNAADDFTLLRLKHPERAHRFTGTGGRPTDEYLSYFNLCGAAYGAVVGLGWTGQWAADLQNRDGATCFSAGQETFSAWLEPGETVRTPLVSLSFYEGGNPVKGFNVFRNWILDCVYPENTPAVVNNLDVLFVSHTRTQAEILGDLETYRPEVLAQVDNFWMDAGWYAGCKEDWSDGNGSWRTDPERFPGGLKAIADRAAETGSGLVVWFEPERLVHGSPLHEVGLAHPRWIVDPAPEDADNDRIMWNLAEPEAVAYLAEYIGGFIRDNGITVYRQDFNFEPLEYWEQADAAYYGGRAGICENRYVQGLYAYLDALFEMNPGLLMDNCASGGRRLDLEMTRRSIPLWRTDYNCSVYPDSLEANQTHTYNLSLWLPVSGVNVYLQSGYAAVSSIFGGNLFTIDSGDSPYFRAFEDVRAAMTGGYYPVTCAGTDPDGCTVMQFGDGDAGYVLVFRHARAGEISFRLSGLEPDADYTLETTLYSAEPGGDGEPETAARSGGDLTEAGLSFSWEKGSPACAMLVRYRRAA